MPIFLKNILNKVFKLPSVKERKDFSNSLVVKCLSVAVPQKERGYLHIYSLAIIFF